MHKEIKNYCNPTMWPSSSFFCVYLCKYVYTHTFQFSAKLTAYTIL